jgi:diguanylate cyclase (GGDEF)-like protein/PAS domain S-box-containing protein
MAAWGDLLDRRDFIETVLARVPSAVLVVDGKGCLVEANPACAGLTGVDANGVRGREPWESLLATGEAGPAAARIARVRSEGRVGRFESRVAGEPGRLVSWTVTPLPEPDGAAGFLVVIGTEVDNRPMVVDNRGIDALYDGLTGLPGRSLFLERLERALIRVTCHPETRFAAMRLDLDGFHGFNARYGKEVGDQLLVAVASRLRRCVRPTDTVARVDGDELGVVLDEIRDGESARIVARRIFRELGRPFDVGDDVETPRMSMGIAIGGAGHRSGEQVFGLAEASLRRAKESASTRWDLYGEP